MGIIEETDDGAYSDDERRPADPAGRAAGDLHVAEESGDGLARDRRTGRGVDRLSETRKFTFGDQSDEHRPHLDAHERVPAGRDRGFHAQGGGPRGLRDGAPDLLRDRADDRHQPQHDPVRRGPDHAGEAGGPGALRADHDAVPEGLPRAGGVRRRRPAGEHQRAAVPDGRAVPHEHARGAAARARPAADGGGTRTSRSSW